MDIRCILILTVSLLLTACVSNQPIPRTPAQAIAVEHQEISTKEAKRRLRDTLVNVLTEMPYTTEGGKIHKFLSPLKYVGAKVGNNPNSVFFLYEDPVLGNSYFRKSALFIDIEVGAKAELYYVPENITRGLVEKRWPSHYALLIKNATICRAYLVDNITATGDFWRFDSKKNLSTTACFGARTGSIRRSIYSTSSDLAFKPLLGQTFNNSYAIIEHQDPEKLQELANLFNSAFSNLK